MSYVVSTIRQRGQLTIPDRVRESRKWASDGSAVLIDDTDPQKIIIHPYSEKKEVDWEKLMRDLERIRSYKGKYKGSLSKFVAKDRETRR